MKDAVIAGGGPAGAALAILLARAGREVEVLESDPGPRDKVCGEFLSREAVLHLGALGIDVASLGALPLSRVTLIRGRRQVSAPLPFAAWSLSRRVLDAALLAAAAAGGAVIRRASRVSGLVAASAGWVARLASGGSVPARTAFLATGKHDLAGRRRGPGGHDDLLAFKLHYRLAPRQAAALLGAVEVMLFPGGYAGLQMVEGGRANLCLVVSGARFAAAGATWERLLQALATRVPHLGQRLDGAEACSPRPLALARIPYGFLAGSSDGLYRIGDQAAVIPSFSGDGIAMALHGARVAARHELGGGDPATFQPALARAFSPQVALATALSWRMVRPSWQPVLLMATRLMPGLLGLIARRTRVPDGELRAAGLEVGAEVAATRA